MRPQNSRHKPIIFLQHSRTAGLAVCAILQEEFGLDRVFKLGGAASNHSTTYEDFKSEARNDAYDVYAGHFVYGAHKHIPRACSYFTILRHPVERLLSRYEGARRLGLTDLKIKAWLASDFESHDGMVKHLCGIGEMAAPGRPYDYMNGRDVSPQMIAGQKELDQAIKNITDHFSCVLMHEYFSENMLILQRQYKTRTLFSFSRQFLNHSERPIQSKDYPDAIIRQIKEQNHFDRLLYEKYKKQFLDGLAGQGDDFQEELRIMKLVFQIVTVKEQQIIPIERALYRLKAAVNQLHNENKIRDGIEVLKRFYQKPYFPKDAFGFVIDYIKAHGGQSDLLAVAANYNARFGDD